MVVKLNFKTTKLRTQRQLRGIRRIFNNVANPTEPTGQLSRVCKDPPTNNSLATDEPSNPSPDHSTLTSEMSLETNYADNPDRLTPRMRQTDTVREVIKAPARSISNCS